MLLTVENVRVGFRKENQSRIFGKEQQEILHGVSLELKKGECLGIVGESGSGKSTLGRIICGLLKPEYGSVRKNGKVSVVFQDYISSVNPRQRVRQVIGEALRLRKKEGAVFIGDERLYELLDLVGLDQSFADRLPYSLSGGQLQLFLYLYFS